MSLLTLIPKAILTRSLLLSSSSLIPLSMVPFAVFDVITHTVITCEQTTMVQKSGEEMLKVIEPGIKTVVSKNKD